MLNPPSDCSSPHASTVDLRAGPINGSPSAASWANGYGRSARGSGRGIASPWRSWLVTSGHGKNLAPEGAVFAIFGAEVCRLLCFTEDGSYGRFFQGLAPLTNQYTTPLDSN